ncbi:MAG TPA: deoxyribodipyrimidine photo-lyase [Puia sp.]|jgi:deoxyribodipyrimidine photo-lyase|nr:deoxyribodipyrimidine photo-lyase [Puia sp.]
MGSKVVIFWFRRDLRLEDNAGLHYALKTGGPVLPLFVYDRNILDGLDNKADRRVEFIQAALVHLQQRLVQAGSSLEVRDGRPVEVFEQLLFELEIAEVWTNGDYEPYARERDEAVKKLLAEKGIPFHSLKDQVVFEKNEVVKDDGDPYTIYTPYSRRWLANLDDRHLAPFPVACYIKNFVQRRPVDVPSLEALGFARTGGPFPRNVMGAGVLGGYTNIRDQPAVIGTSRMGVHLRFGTVSIRDLARRARAESATYLRELIWRDFFQMILWHFPAVGKGRAFKPVYDLIRWRNNEQEFGKWCEGKTGYPLVDAGMRELNATGFMHNRARMVAASFLTKHLLIDWRWGEAYFAEKLLDFDLAANNGNWQWAAGCGCDAAPYFRVFNPVLQAQRFDPEGLYVRMWVPELGRGAYPKPIVEHEMARRRALEVYGAAVKGGRG